MSANYTISLFLYTFYFYVYYMRRMVPFKDKKTTIFTLDRMQSSIVVTRPRHQNHASSIINVKIDVTFTSSAHGYHHRPHGASSRAFLCV